MRQLAAISFVLLLLVQTWSLTLTYVYYQLCRDYITEQFCVNVDQPQVLCYGQCHLQKLVEEDQRRHEDPAAPGAEEFKPIIGLLQANTLLPILMLTQRHSLPTYTLSIDTWLLVYSVFHPPQGLLI